MVKSSLKTLTKKVETDVASRNLVSAKESLKNVVRAVDKARTKGIIHRNTAARKVSRLVKLVKSLSQPEAT